MPAIVCEQLITKGVSLHQQEEAVIDKSHWSLHGPVRTVRSEIAEWDGVRGKWGAARFHQAVTFDAAGHVVRLDERGPEDSTYRTAYTYDGGGRLLASQSGPSDGEARYRRRWTYDRQGRVESVALTGEDADEQPYARSTYDERGRRTEIKTFRPDIRIDSYGIEGSEFGYGAPGAVSQTTRYDEAGRSIEVLFHNAAGAAVRRVTLLRDAAGRVIDEEADMAGALPLPRQPGMSDADLEQMRALVAQAFGTMRTRYEYDEAGRATRRVQQMGQLGEDRVTFRYDERGNPVEQDEVQVKREMNFDEDNVPHAAPDTTRVHQIRFAYAYDARGNWIERTVSARISEDAAFAPGSVERRTIEYFE